MASRPHPGRRLELTDVEVSVGSRRRKVIADGDVTVAGPRPDASGEPVLAVAVDVAKPGAPDHETELRLSAGEARALREALSGALEEL